MIPMSDSEFLLFQECASKILNVKVGKNMRQVLTGQLQPLLAKYNYSNFKELCDNLKKNAHQENINEILNILTPDHTFFFREKDHFDFFHYKFLPQLYQNMRKGNLSDLRVWCSACSTGEESYTLAMLIADFFKDKPSYENGILATDISLKSLKKAIVGQYEMAKTSRIPPHFKSQFMTPNESLSHLIMNKNIKSMITFRKFNLMSANYPFKHPFDAIFCRNVLIYFDGPTIDKVIAEFFRFTKVGGYLFIGASESLQGRNCSFIYRAPGIYQRVK